MNQAERRYEELINSGPETIPPEDALPLGDREDMPEEIDEENARMLEEDEDLEDEDFEEEEEEGEFIDDDNIGNK